MRSLKYICARIDKRLVTVHHRHVEKAMLSSSVPVAIVYSMSIGFLLLAYSFDKNRKEEKHSLEDNYAEYEIDE